MKPTIPLMKPLLPDRQALEPYLAEIDKNRWYSNFGPLERRFEARLAEYFQIGSRQLVCVSNGTQALSISLKTVARSPVGCCLLPSFTFAATPHAAVGAGLEPYFLDVNRETWALNPKTVEAVLKNLDVPVAAVMPVAPFGAPFNIEEWDEFHRITGIPVVIDAAAGFDSATAGLNPVIISLHATKAMGIGEGGLILCRDNNLAEQLRAARNFGFLGERVAEIPGMNAKLSEYGAAVGLAALDGWSDRRAQLCRIVADYLDVFEGIEHLRFAPGFGLNNAVTTCNVTFQDPVASQIIDALREEGIETRRWWNRGCHLEPVFAGCQRTSLDCTEYLADRVVGLPFHIDLDKSQIERIRDAVMHAIAR